MGAADFLLEDLKNAERVKGVKVSVHIVDQMSPFINVIGVDTILAFCHSEASLKHVPGPVPIKTVNASES